MAYTYQEKREFARKMRLWPKQPEWEVWKRVRAKRLGFKIRRQRVVGNFIVDFCCCRTKLAIEIDGGYHNKPEQQIKDKFREGILRSNGWTIIRFTNEQVMNDIEWVLSEIVRVGSELPILPLCSHWRAPSRSRY